MEYLKNMNQIFCHKGNIIKYVGRKGEKRKHTGHTSLTLKANKVNYKINSSLEKWKDENISKIIDKIGIEKSITF